MELFLFKIIPKSDKYKLDQIKKTYNKKIIQINELEIKKHKLFLKNEIKKNFF